MGKTIKLTNVTSMHYNLENLLMGYTKAQQLEIADSLNKAISKSWKKSKIAMELSLIIQEQAQTVYQEILEEMIKKMPNQEQSAYFVESLDGISSLNPLIDKGFIYVHQVNESYMLIIPEEILAIAASDEASWNEEAQDPQESESTAEIIHKWKESMLAIYGTVSAEHLYRVWNRHFSQKLSIDEIRDMLSN